MPKLTQQRVQELFILRRDGKLVHRFRAGETRGIRIFNGRNAGKVAGTLHSKGYILVRFDGIGVWAHRVVYLHKYGWLPKQLDHKDRDRTNNRPSNLRPVTGTVNNVNSMGKRGRSGHRGVDKRGNRWVARIKHNRVRHHLGTFDTRREAVSARRQAELHYWGENCP